MQTDDTDRPMEPPLFLDAEVVWNPFEDIVPRSTKEEREAEAAAKRRAICTISSYPPVPQSL